MRRYLWMIGILVGLMVASVALPVLAQSSYPNRKDTFINDYNGLMSSELEAKLSGWLTDLKTQHNIEMTVVTIDRIRDYASYTTSLESFATGLFNRWVSSRRKKAVAARKGSRRQ